MIRMLVPAAALVLSACGTQPEKNESQIMHGPNGEVLHLSIEEVETPQDVLEQVQSDIKAQRENGELQGFGLNGVDIATMINVGKEVWAIIEKGKPVANVKYDYATAIPKGVADAGEPDGFSNLVHKSYRLEAKNLYKMKVFSLTYTLVHQYGGNYNGKGKYLAGVSVIPSSVDVLWGYNMDFQTTKVTTTNVGSKEKPVGSVTMEMKLKLSTILKSSEQNYIYQFRGDSAKVNSVR